LKRTKNTALGIQVIGHCASDLISVRVKRNSNRNDEKGAHTRRKYKEKDREKRCDHYEAHYDDLDKARAKAGMPCTSRARSVGAKGEEVARLVEEPLLYLRNRDIVLHPGSVMLDI
jgi:hypothetical protein